VRSPLGSRARERLASAHSAYLYPPPIPLPPPPPAWDWENGRVRFYIDGATTPSLDVTILELSHVGHLGAVGNNPPADGSPFGHDLFGKTAHTGGVYTTMRIPFQTSLRTTIQAAPSCGTQSIFWFVIRGIEGLPIQLGSEIELPDQAAIALYRNDFVDLVPEEFITVAAAPAGTAGALISVLFDAVSHDYNFLEACVRFYDNGSPTPIYLSSGTEDFFLSASYYDEGKFTTSQSGLTYYDGAGSAAMYKTFASRDHLVFQSGLNMTWRNMENSCPTTWPWAGTAEEEGKLASSAPSSRSTLSVGPANVSTLAFMYTWPSNADELTYGGVPAAIALASRRAGTAAAATAVRLASVRRVAALIGEHAEDAAVDAVVAGGNAALEAVLDAYATAEAAVLARHVKRVLAKAA
jgi:hypothetical protein